MSLGNAVYQVVSVGAKSPAPRYPTPLPALWFLVEFYLRGPDGSIRAARPTCCTLLRRDPCFDASVRIGRVGTPDAARGPGHSYTDKNLYVVDSAIGVSQSPALLSLREHTHRVEVRVRDSRPADSQ